MIKEITRLVFFLFFSANIIVLLGAQTLPEQPAQIPYPQNTETIESSFKFLKPYNVEYYAGLSSLTQAEVIKFYRTFFISEKKWKVESEKKIGQATTLNFITGAGMIDRAVLSVRTPYPKDRGEQLAGKVRFDITIMQNQDVLGLSIAPFSTPTRLTFAPTISHAEQIATHNEKSQFKVVAYLTRLEVKEIDELYRKEMPKFKWILEGTQTYEGAFNVLDIFAKGHEKYGNNKPRGEEVMPGIKVTVASKVLTFKHEQNKEDCVINIIQFNDSPEVLRENRIAPEPFQEHGNVWVQLLVYNQAMRNQ